MGNDPYSKLAISIFGNLAEEYQSHFPGLRDDLRKAAMHQTIDEYVATAALTTVLAPLMTMPFALLVTFILGLDLLIAFGIVLAVGFITAMLVITFLYFYPSIKSDTIKRSIENNMPFATIYLSTLAGTGMPTSAIFRILADFPEYGEVSKQAQAIVTDTEIMGFDITNALERATLRTPSDTLKDLLWGVRSTILTGGDLKKFLLEKSKGYMATYRRNIDAYVEELSLFTELYITAVIVGSIFFIVMSTIMNMIGSSGSFMIMLQSIVIYILLPLVSIGFMILVSVLSPG